MPHKRALQEDRQSNRSRGGDNLSDGARVENAQRHEQPTHSGDGGEYEACKAASNGVGVDVGRVWVGCVAAACVLLGGEGRDGWSLKVRQG